MVGEKVMLTAGHVVYKSTYGGYCDKLVVYPSRNRLYAPYGPYTASEITVTTQFENNVVQTDDWGYVKFKSDIGSTTGYFGLKSTASTTALIGTKVTVTGYPTDLTSGLGMWKSTGEVKCQNFNVMGYTCSTGNGESGSPVYNNSNKVIGIHVRNSGYSSDEIYRYNNGQL